MKWFVKLAKHGDYYAECLIGVMYYGGKGVNIDYKQLGEWLEKSVARGNENAKTLLAQLKVGNNLCSHKNLLAFLVHK